MRRFIATASGKKTNLLISIFQIKILKRYFQIFDPNDVNVYLFQTIAASLAAFLQIIYFSFFGDLIMTNLLTVSITVYMETDWYNYPPNVRRQLLFVMLRSQKMFIFKGFGLDFVRCSRDNFTNVSIMRVRNSYSLHHFSTGF